VLVGRVGTFSAVVGAVYGLGSTGGRFGAALIGTFDGLTIGLALAAIGTFILDAPVGAPVRRLPVSAAMSLRASIYVLVIAGGLQLGETLSIVSQVGVRADSDATPNLFFALFVATIISIVQTLRRIIGPGLLPLLAGRYRHPQEEERAVLFLDVRDSTPIAEQLGNKRFVQFLDEVIFTATEPIMEAGGEIYKYVGDEIIATWPMRGHSIDPRCLRCAFSVIEAVEARRSRFERKYGVVPRFRIGLHAGPLVVSELGDAKREIVLVGDVMNTTARITDFCRDSAHSYLASSSVMSRLSLPADLHAKSIGNVALRGKSEGLELFAVEVGIVSTTDRSSIG
jgi:adenylate cyclase